MVMGRTKLKWKKELLFEVETYVEDDIQQVNSTPNVMMFEYPVHIPQKVTLNKMKNSI